MRMRVPERYWWLLVLFGCVAVGGAVLAPIYVLSLLVPLDQELGNSLTSDYLFAAAYALLMLVIAALLLGSGLRGRARYRQRRAALAGNLAAIPLANVPLVLAPPNLADGPLVLSWRASKQMRFLMGPLFVLIFALQGVLLLVSFGLGIYSAVHAFQTGASLTSQDARLYGLSLVSLIIVIGGGAIFVRYLPTIFGRPFGVRATAEGIVQRTQGGRRVFARWEEMRLFEMEARSTGSRHYWVYGQRDVVDWENAPGGLNDFILDGHSAGEFVLRLSALVALVHAKTGLAPRTFSKRFQSPNEAAPSASPRAKAAEANSRRDALVTALLAVGFALVTGALGAAVWLLPLTSSPALNGAVALPLVGVVVALLVALLVRLARGAPSPHLVPLLAPPASVEGLASSPDGAYALAFQPTLLYRLVLALVGLLLVIDLVPVVLLVFMRIFSTSTVFGLSSVFVLPSASSGTGFAVAVVTFTAVGLSLYGMLGLGALTAAFRKDGATVRADALGLSTGTGATAVALPWASIAGVEERMREGRVAGYIVRERDGAHSISWPAQATIWSRMAPARGAQSITPEALAGLVLSRIAQLTYRAPHP